MSSPLPSQRGIGGLLNNLRRDDLPPGMGIDELYYDYWQREPVGSVAGDPRGQVSYGPVGTFGGGVRIGGFEVPGWAVFGSVLIAGAVAWKVLR